MAEIINLRRVRKNKSRVEAEAAAHANRLAHGRSKAEKLKSKAEKDDADRKLDGHKRHKPGAADDE